MLVEGALVRLCRPLMVLRYVYWLYTGCILQLLYSPVYQSLTLCIMSECTHSSQPSVAIGCIIVITHQR